MREAHGVGDGDRKAHDDKFDDGYRDDGNVNGDGYGMRSVELWRGPYGSAIIWRRPNSYGYVDRESQGDGNGDRAHGLAYGIG